MSMLKYFFEAGTDRKLFDGLAISAEKELCEKYTGKFPVISISLKGVGGRDFEAAKNMLRSAVGNEAMRFAFLEQSERLTERERQRYSAVVYPDNDGSFAMSDKVLQDSLLILSQCLQKYYGKKVVILIDEYDVPLDKAYQSGYYDDMVELIRSLFGQAFKTNDSLFLAVLTGCLRVPKESIFTGLNNFSVYTVRDVQYNEYFGFADEEVREMLTYYGRMELVIPNKEIRWIFVDQIQEWFEEETVKDSRKMENLCRAFEENDTAAIEEGFNSYLSRTISIHDNSVRKNRKENFYHGILLGIFSNRDGWRVRSNAESGDGYSDISVEAVYKEIGFVIELKCAENARFDEGCREALRQILDRNYEEQLLDDGMKTIYRYGIACYKKRCKVISG